MRPVKALALCLFLALPACGTGLPGVEDMASPAALASDYPQLVPLGPLLSDASALRPRTAIVEGVSLEARTADLRRRARLLRAMRLS